MMRNPGRAVLAMQLAPKWCESDKEKALYIKDIITCNRVLMRYHPEIHAYFLKIQKIYEYSPDNNVSKSFHNKLKEH